MSIQELIATEIGRASGRPFDVRSAREAGGGCISRALVLESDDSKWFVKLNGADALDMFQAESDGLAALAGTDAFRVPRPLCAGVAGEQAYLVLEHLDLRPVGERSDDRSKSKQDAIAFGHALAALHRKSGLRYGWKRDNFIGATPQVNAENDSWPRFFAAARLLPQVERATAHGHGLRAKGELLSEKLPALFLDQRPQPSLLHGDLWHGNAAMCAGTPAVFDPAVYYGDRETDLAMTELFGGFPEAFYAAYREAWPLAEGHETRKTLYNLYHVLNHLNLFGAGYLRQAERMIDRLLAELHG